MLTNRTLDKMPVVNSFLYRLLLATSVLTMFGCDPRSLTDSLTLPEGPGRHLINSTPGAVTQLPVSLKSNIQTSPAAYVFIEHHRAGNIQNIKGNYPALSIDFPEYRFDENAGTLRAYMRSPLELRVDESLSAVLGSKSSLSGRGSGIFSRAYGVYQLPYELDGLKITSIAGNGAINIVYNNESITLNIGERWQISETVIDNKLEGSASITTIDSITNHGIFAKAGIVSESSNTKGFPAANVTPKAPNSTANISPNISHPAGNATRNATRNTTPSANISPNTSTPSVKNIPALFGNPMPLEAYKTIISLNAGAALEVQLPASGGMPPYTWTMWSKNLPPGYETWTAGLPEGVTLDTSGYLTGTLPAKPGNYYFSLMLRDSGGSSVVAEYYLMIKTASATGTAEGGPVNGGGGLFTISRDFEFKAARAFGRFGESGYLQRGAADLTSDQFVYMVPLVSGGTRPWTFIIDGLPEGLTYDPATGIIYGTLDKAKKRTPIEIRTYLKDADGKIAIPENGSRFQFRVDYVQPSSAVQPPSGDRGTLSASGGAGNILSLSGYGNIGIGSAVVTVPAGSYILTVTSPAGAVLYQGRVLIEVGKVTTARISVSNWGTALP